MFLGKPEEVEILWSLLYDTYSAWRIALRKYKPELMGLTFEDS